MCMCVLFLKPFFTSRIVPPVSPRETAALLEKRRKKTLLPSDCKNIGDANCSWRWIEKHRKLTVHLSGLDAQLRDGFSVATIYGIFDWLIFLFHVKMYLEDAFPEILAKINSANHGGCGLFGRPLSTAYGPVDFFIAGCGMGHCEACCTDTC